MQEYTVDISYEVHVKAKNKKEAEEIANEKVYDGYIDPDVLVTEEE